MLSRSQRLDRQLVVRLRRRGDHQRVAGGKQRGKIQSGSARLAADRPGAFIIGIEHARQRGLFRPRDLQRMVAAEMADAGNANSKWR